ncbi:MAG: sulfotransferase domain-containing protein [Candidatus Omnitrophica bacterium]|nr:sulfotransferase domain-containing protein [Candidatus Omnitrophota bacterium]
MWPDLSRSSEKILIVSPREPCGVAWLINCLLELGIKAYPFALEAIWQTLPSGHCRLTERGKTLRKWLPALSVREDFVFRTGVEVTWHHQWPERSLEKQPVIFFTRDPRSCLYSRYKREKPDLSFSEFLAFPDPYTLLNKADHLCLFHLCWMDFQDFKVFRFEDYKKDDQKTLREILDYAGLDADDKDLARATGASTFKSAAATEQAYRRKHPEDRELINRSGKISEWESDPQAAEAVSQIEHRCADLLQECGYGSRSLSLPKRSDYTRHFRFVPFFKAMHIDPDLYVSDESQIGVLADEVFEFAESLSEDLIRRAGLSGEDTALLLENLSSFCYAAHPSDHRPSLIFGKARYKPLKKNTNSRNVC